MEETARALDKAGIAEWVELFRQPRRLLYLNFAAGVVRGFGVAIGFTLVSALVLIFLGYLAQLNLPFIGQFIADLMRVVKLELAGF